MYKDWILTKTHRVLLNVSGERQYVVFFRLVISSVLHCKHDSVNNESWPSGWIGTAFMVLIFHLVQRPCNMAAWQDYEERDAFRFSTRLSVALQRKEKTCWGNWISGCWGDVLPCLRQPWSTTRSDAALSRQQGLLYFTCCWESKWCITIGLESLFLSPFLLWQITQAWLTNHLRGLFWGARQNAPGTLFLSIAA